MCHHKAMTVAAHADDVELIVLADHVSHQTTNEDQPHRQSSGRLSLNPSPRCRTLNSSARSRHINHSDRRRHSATAILCIPKLLISKLLRAAVADFTLYETVEPAPDRSKPESKLSYRSGEREAHGRRNAESNEESATSVYTCSAITITRMSSQCCDYVRRCLH